MQRRNFFTQFSRANTVRRSNSDSSTRPIITSGLEAYTPALSLADAMHLLRRVSFGPTLSAAKSLVGMSASQAVDTLLGDGTDSDPASPGAWVDSADENPDNLDIISRSAIEAKWAVNFSDLQYWWVELMRSENSPLREKLSLFWSGHFTSEFTYDQGFIPPQALYRQNQLFRRLRLGNFKNFLANVTTDCSMLLYLGGVLNIKGTANENYAREMMELFSCGLGQYTEGDVKNAARVLTGWKAAVYSDAPAKNGIFNSYFNPPEHDTEAKQYLEHTIAARADADNTEFQVRTEEIGGMLDILFNYRSAAIGSFISQKLYRYFVYSSPSASDMAVIQQMSDLFQQQNFELRPLMKALLCSAHFFDEANRGVQIKTPAEFAVGMARQCGIVAPKSTASSTDATKGTMSSMEQVLMDPPNVAGWPGYRNWITTKTYPQRLKYGRDLISALTDANVQQLISQFSNYHDVYALTNDMVAYFFPKSIAQTRIDHYVSILLSGGKDYEWPAIADNGSTCGVRIRSLLNAMIKAPDFHLC